MNSLTFEDDPIRLPAQSRVEFTYQQLFNCLEKGEWQAGERLPSEGDLSIRFDVSRPVVRQALARLKAESRIYSRKGAGHYVRELGAALAYNVGTLKSIPDVRRFLEFRCYIESEVAAQAAEMGSPEAIAEIERCYQLHLDAMARGESGIQEDINFHFAIAKASTNRFFLPVIAGLAQQTQSAIQLTRQLADRPITERYAEIRAEHGRLCDRIKAKDSEGARQAMVDHLEGGIRRLFEL